MYHHQQQHYLFGVVAHDSCQFGGGTTAAAAAAAAAACSSANPPGRMATGAAVTADHLPALLLEPRLPTAAEWRAVLTGHAPRIVTRYQLMDTSVEYWTTPELVAWTMLHFGRRCRAYAAAFAWRAASGATLYAHKNAVARTEWNAELYTIACRLASGAGRERCALPSPKVHAEMVIALFELWRANTYVPVRRTAACVTMYTTRPADIADGTAFGERAPVP